MNDEKFKALLNQARKQKAEGKLVRRRGKKSKKIRKYTDPKDLLTQEEKKVLYEWLNKQRDRVSSKGEDSALAVYSIKLQYYKELSRIFSEEQSRSLQLESIYNDFAPYSEGGLFLKTYKKRNRRGLLRSKQNGNVGMMDQFGGNFAF